jgi:hypothetical protein
MHPLFVYLNYLITECYEEDYNPYYAETWRDNYCFHFTFAQWYFIYRKYAFCKRNECKYKHTHEHLLIGKGNNAL